MKTMNMNEEINKNRVGIYAQESAGVTTVGDGLASKDVKSPVTKIESEKNDTENVSKENCMIVEHTIEKHTEQEEEEQQQKQDKKLEQEKEEEQQKQDKKLEQEKEEEEQQQQQNKKLEQEKEEEQQQQDKKLEQENKGEEQQQQQDKKPEQEKEEEQQQDTNLEQENEEKQVNDLPYSSDSDDVMSHHSWDLEIKGDQNKGLVSQVEEQDNGLVNSSNMDDVMSHHSSEFNETIPIPIVRSLEISSTDLNNHHKATKLQTFRLCEEHYGKERCDKALVALEKIGFVNWEINTMFSALHRFCKKAPKRKASNDEPPHQMDSKRKTNLDHSNTKEKTEVISGVLLTEKYSTFDLRANIGDAGHPHFHILPENRDKFYVEFHKFLDREECFPDDSIISSNYVNQTLMIECRSAEILENIDRKINRMNGLWPGADFVMMPRSCENKKIQICIPYRYSDTAEMLEIIKKQNKLAVDKWTVNNCEQSEDGVCLDVEVDGGTYIRLLQDQDDIFFLMKKATIKLPLTDDSYDS